MEFDLNIMAGIKREPVLGKAKRGRARIISSAGESLPHVRPFEFFPYQNAAFQNRDHGLEVWLWGRQTGKSFTLAAWAVDRLISRPGRLVTILSNSRANGMELNLKCAEFCRKLRHAFEQEDLSPDHRFETMNYETRITIHGQVGRIKVLPANPRTARGFSGDLILDEFAYHENSTAIWEAAEPILSAHPDYLCRIASTPNGRHNMFYRLATNPAIPVRKVPRSEAWKAGLKIYHPITREPITPEQARELAVDKHAYDQNYECIFETENMALLTHELIHAAEREDVGIICDQDWSEEALKRFNNEDPSGSSISNSQIGNPHSEIGPFYVGVDVGRNRDLTVITVIEKVGHSLIVRGILRLSDMRLPDQQERLAAICRLKNFRAAHIDMTGLGLGLFEYTQKTFGYRVRGINFASNVPLSHNPVGHGERVRVPEHLALQLLQAYEDRRIQHPVEKQLRDDLRKPERTLSPAGRVSIAATRDDAGHADHFWSFALAVDAAMERPEPAIQVVRLRNRIRVPRRRLVM